MMQLTGREKFDDIFRRFDTIHEYDEQTPADSWHRAVKTDIAEADSLEWGGGVDDALKRACPETRPSHMG